MLDIRLIYYSPIEGSIIYLALLPDIP